MGLDRAPNEILTFIFSPLEVRPPSVSAIFDQKNADTIDCHFSDNELDGYPVKEIY